MMVLGYLRSSVMLFEEDPGGYTLSKYASLEISWIVFHVSQ